MEYETEQESDNNTWIPLILLTALFIVCSFCGFVFLAVWGPIAGIFGAILGFGVYCFLGPPPMPGLLAGIFALQNLFASLTALVISIIKL